MDLTITMRVCDICKSGDRPTSRYVLTPEEGEPRAKDLCDEHAAPVRAVFGQDVTVDKSGEPTPLEAALTQTKAAIAEELARHGTLASKAQAPTVEQRPSAVKPPAKKAPAKKAATKKAAAKTADAAPAARRSRRTPVMTMEEIDAMKKASQS
ncbi:hypothetical protein ACFQ64_04370 [Streptomyces sp. NPDC056460]|uniref:hypothetical protein n=1 Tax=Streptomyces sp. NPDC056460 TaxID=3345825 RepID=UPI0036B858AC